MMMDSVFWASKSLPPLSSFEEPEFFLIELVFFDCIHLKKESHIHYDGLRVSKSWHNFHFWVNYPIKGRSITFDTKFNTLLILNLWFSEL